MNSATEVLIAFLVAWVHQHGRLPAPCPPNIEDCAEWWITHMQEPERKSETGRTRAEAGGQRIMLGYAERVRSALFGFLSLANDKEREAVARMVINDKIPYRGDTFAFYLSVVQETETMREDPQAYIRKACGLLQRKAAV